MFGRLFHALSRLSGTSFFLPVYAGICTPAREKRGKAPINYTLVWTSGPTGGGSWTHRFAYLTTSSFRKSSGSSLLARPSKLQYATGSALLTISVVSHHPQINHPHPLLSHPAMSLSCRYAAQCCARQLRSTPTLRTSAGALAQQRISRRYQSTEAAAPADPKIAGIVDQISKLTLLETADLVSSLKVGRCRSPRVAGT
jgi:large subunit ribosomal protein L7/L12